MSTAVVRPRAPALLGVLRWSVGFAGVLGVLAASPGSRAPHGLLLAFGMLGGLSLSGAV